MSAAFIAIHYDYYFHFIYLIIVVFAVFLLVLLLHFILAIKCSNFPPNFYQKKKNRDKSCLVIAALLSLAFLPTFHKIINIFQPTECDSVQVNLLQNGSVRSIRILASLSQLKSNKNFITIIIWQIESFKQLIFYYT